MVGKQREVVALKDYCLNMPVLSHFPIPGALPQWQKDDKMVIKEKPLLTEPAQEVSRVTLVFLGELFNLSTV